MSTVLQLRSKREILPEPDKVTKGVIVVEGEITELAVRLRDGSHDALRQCYGQWSSLIFTLAYRSTGNRADADDITQRTFIAAWESREKLKPSQTALPAWLVGIAKYKIADHHDAAMRHQRRVEKAKTVVSVVSKGPEDYVPADVVAAGLLQDQPEPRRTVLTLAILEDQTHQMISDQLQMPLGTVKSHVRRGLESIRAALKEVHHG